MALVTDYGVLGQGDEILQPMLRNRFKIELLNFGGEPEILTLQVIQVTLPKLSFEDIQLDRYNSRAWIAGKHTFETASFTFESDIGTRLDRSIVAQLERQQGIVAVNSRARFPASRAGQLYKFRTDIHQLDGDNAKFQTFRLHGCYINNVDYGDLDYSASETRKTTLTLRYDHATVDNINTQNLKATGTI